MDKLLTWIGQFLRLLDTWTGNYILALLLFALLIEVLMLPFGIKQQKNSIKQARLRPKEMAIRKKYAGRDDQATKQKIAQEIQDLYQKENFNQFAGCLPMLIQLPIIMILYYVVINPLHYEMGVSTAAIDALRNFLTASIEDGGLGKALANNTKSTIEIISLLRDPATWDAIKASFGTFAEGNAAHLLEFENIIGNLPDFSAFGINLGDIPSITNPSWLWSIPVLTFGAYFGSMKLNRKLTYQPTTQTQDMGCSNNVMDIMMPAFSVYITFVVPAAVGVYWIFKSILGTIKQFILFKVFPLPQFTEEDYKAAERELAGKNPKKTQSSSTSGNKGPKPGVRSLHHIDDDDYLPPVNQNNKKQSAPKSTENNSTEPVESAPEEKIESPIEEAPLKEDRYSVKQENTTSNTVDDHNNDSQDDKE